MEHFVISLQFFKADYNNCIVGSEFFVDISVHISAEFNRCFYTSCKSDRYSRQIKLNKVIH